jgi:hypothetical protein
VRVDLVHATTERVSPVTNANVVSFSSSMVTPVHGELIASVPEPGIYYLNAYVDDRLTGATLLFAETESPSLQLHVDAGGPRSRGEW